MASSTRTRRPRASEEVPESTASSPSSSSSSSSSTDPVVDPAPTMDICSTDLERLQSAGITPDLYPELLDVDMTQLGLSFPTIFAIRRTRTGARDTPASPTRASAAPSSPTFHAASLPQTTAVRPSIPTFRGSGSASYSDADEFISRFEIAMLCSDQPQQRWNLTLLNQFANFTDLQFWQANAMHLDWDDAKALFIHHFRHPNATQMRIDELTRIRQRPHESIREYLDRFASLVRLAGQPEDSPLLVSYFRRGIHNSELRRLLDLREDIRTPYATYHDISEAASFCEAQLQRQRLDQDLVHKPPTKASPPGCTFHGPSSTHSTKDCRVLQQRHPPRSPDTPVKHDRDQHSAKPKMTCWKCNGEGHYANKCPNSTHRAASSTSSPASSSSTPSKSAINMMESDLDTPQLTLSDPVISSTDCPDQSDPPELYVSVLIRDTELQGLVDTGANRSYIKQSHVESLQLPTISLQRSVRLGDGSSTHQSSATDATEFTSNGHTLQHSFGILPNICYDLIIGRDLLCRLGIGIQGIIMSSLQTSTAQGDDDMLDDPKTCDSVDLVSSDDLAAIREGISSALDQNVQIPEHEFCTFPGSQVHIRTDDHKPIFRRQYPIAHTLQSAVTEQIEKWLRTNRIRRAHSSTQWNLPLTVAPKKDLLGHKTAVRVCLDPRALNVILPDDNYPIPRISDLFDKLRGFRVASSLDLRESYTQLRVNDDDQEKLSFTWNSVRYSWQGAPYGLKFLTSHFQRVMTAILHECHAFCIIFVDDVVVFSASISQHIDHLRRVIQALNDANLRLNLDKCRFGCTQLPVLGHIMSSDQIRPDPDKISSLHNLPVPHTGKQIESFLGLANYLRDYIPLYSKIATPLEKLRKRKTIGAEWTADCQHAFDTLKLVLSQAPVLSAADPDHPLLVATDASQYGVGAALYQLINNTPRYIAFASRALNKAQTNYPATLRELLAVVFAVSKFRNWLYGRHFTLYCDHSALSYLFTGKHESRMLNYWAYSLCEYNFSIVHRPGVLNILPDALSRLYDSPLRGESATSSSAQLNVIELDASHRQPTTELKQFIEQRFDKTSPDADRQTAILEEAHGLNHLGADALFKQVWSQGYYWPSLLKDCKRVTAQCQTCQQFNIVRQGFHPLNPIHAELPFDHLAIDLAGPFPTSHRGHNFLLVVTDIASRFTLLRSLTDKTANTVALHLYHVFCDFGFPKILQSDNGTEFVNSTMKELKQQFGFDHRTISPYHPQANGAAESHVKIAKHLLVKLCHGDWTNWDLFVPAAQFGMNSRITKRHGSAPFTLMFARIQNSFKSYQDAVSRPLSDHQLRQRVDHMTRIVFPAIHDKTKSTSTTMTHMFDKQHKIVTNGFPAGSQVMLSVASRQSKLHPQYEGPFKILRRTKGGSYTLLDSTGSLYPKNVSPDKLKIISLPDAAPSYEVERILDHRGPISKREYLVRWKGYSADHDSWEPASNFDSPLLIQQYHQHRLQAGRE